MSTPTTALVQRIQDHIDHTKICSVNHESVYWANILYSVQSVARDEARAHQEEVERLTHEAKGWHEQYDVATRNRNDLLAVADQKVAKLTSERDLARENLRKHGERLVSLTRDLAEEQLNRRTLRDELVNTIAERDNANLVSETVGKELKRVVDQGYAREGKLTSDLKDARSNLSRHFENVCKERDAAQGDYQRILLEYRDYKAQVQSGQTLKALERERNEARNATNRVRQEVYATTNSWIRRSNPNPQLSVGELKHFQERVEAAAQPMADEAAGNAGVKYHDYLSPVGMAAANELATAIVNGGNAKASESAMCAIIRLMC